MGQKVNPIAFRNQVLRQWRSSWYRSKDYSSYLVQDLKIQNFFNNIKTSFLIGSVKIERVLDKISITVHTAKPGFFIKKAGDGIGNLTDKLRKVCGVQDISISVKDVKNPNLSADVVAASIAGQIEKRSSYIRVAKRAISDTMRSGALGIKIICSGRLAGAEIARSETYMEGSVPLQSIRANVGYALSEAVTTYGVIGVKVWIYNKK